MAKSPKRGTVEPPTPEPPSSPTACVAIAATAGAQQALCRLLANLSADTGAAFVITSPDETERPPGDLLEVLRPVSRLPLLAANDGAPLEPDKIYVARDGDLVTVEDGRLRVGRQDPNDGPGGDLAADRADSYGEAVRLAGIGVWEWNPDTEESWWSPVVYQLWGLPPGETPPALAERRIHADDRAMYAAALEDSKATGELNVEWRVVAPDGTTRWLAETARLGRANGARLLGVIQDVTHWKVAETRQTILLGELQHRVRNILGVVRSVVARTVRSSSSLDELAAALDGRLDTLARTQGGFARDVAVELEDLIRDELVAVAAREAQLTIEGPRVKLKRDAAEAFALALHELTTNAVKYGALFEPGGRLAITWSVFNTNKGPRLALEWRESGVRALDVRPSRSGFGRELIERGLPYELGANTSLEFGRGGLKALIDVPLTDRIADLETLGREEVHE